MFRRMFAIALTLVVWLSGLGVPTAAAQGPREGIIVHGNWVIEVTNPDGTVAERREFENALREGAEVLARLLRGKSTMGPMTIYLGDTAGVTIRAGGIIGTIGDNPESPFDNGRIEAVDASPDESSLVIFKGAVTAVRAGKVSSVTTLTKMCAGSIPATACSPTASDMPWFWRFTAKFLTSPSGPTAPIDLVKDQSVHVTVTFSFTSPSGGN